jgi:hypothetical protein
MAWRDFYANPTNEQKQLVETTELAVSPEEAVASVSPVIVPPVETVLAPDLIVAPTSLITESGIACRIEGSAMPPPVVTDSTRLCSRVHKFLGKSFL